MLTALLLGTLFFSSTAGLHGSGSTQHLQAGVAAAISTLDSRMISTLLEQPSQCVCPNTRSLLDIIWSCLSTIFLCTWVSVHPNMPPKGENAIKTFLRRFKLMFAALIGPETVLMFSTRQWISAREISKEYKNRGWTMTHGFFLIMGGFVLKRGDEDLGIISRDLFRQLNEAGEIHFPSVTQEEIKDKSKGDVLSKGLVILQTLWFTIQCIARGAQGLALTELEAVTLAFCSLNAAMYFMWWYKPLDVECPIPVYLKEESNYVHKFELERAKEIDDVDYASRQIAQALKQVEDGRADEGSDSTKGYNLKSMLSRLVRRFRRFCGVVFNKVKSLFDECVFHMNSQWRKDLAIVNYVAILIPFWVCKGILWIICSPLFFLGYALIMIVQLLGDKDSERLLPGRNRVHSFYAPVMGVSDDTFIIALFGITGAIFGGLHLIPWRFHFPTHTEALMWRYISLGITIVPLGLPFGRYLVDDLHDYIKTIPHKQGGPMGLVYKVWYGICYAFYGAIMGCIVGPFFLYFPARLFLLVEAFVLLRQLPPLAILDINWQNFIPHF